MLLWTADCKGGAAPTSRLGGVGRTMLLGVVFVGGAPDTPVGDGLVASSLGMLIWTTLGFAGGAIALAFPTVCCDNLGF